MKIKAMQKGIAPQKSHTKTISWEERKELKSLRWGNSWNVFLSRFIWSFYFDKAERLGDREGKTKKAFEEYFWE